MRIPYGVMFDTLERILTGLGFTPDKASAIAGIFSTNSLEGVYTHGLNRFPVFVRFVREGTIDIGAEPERELGLGGLERWNGKSGPGMLNARFCMDRAVTLAKANGIGCVAVNHTNHWMRGGTYGWQAANQGCIGICFTNTTPFLAPWGGEEARLGNNPLVIAVPRKEGPVVLDMAVSQYSFGKLLQYQASGVEELPYPGGYDREGRMTARVADILETKRLLPAGLWKGAGLSLLLDLLATVLSQGNSAGDIGGMRQETGVSQVFLAIRPVGDGDISDRLIEHILNYTASARRSEADRPIRYPGESILLTRKENTELGIPVEERIWAEVLNL